MPSMALHSYFWMDQGEVVPPGPPLSAMSRILGPPLTALLILAASGLWRALF